jgi:hypothetical protein
MISGERKNGIPGMIRHYQLAWFELGSAQVV